LSEVVNSDNLPEDLPFSGGISLLSTLYRTQITALVGLNSGARFSNQMVMLYDCSQQKEWHQEIFNTFILKVLIIKDRLIVVLAADVYIFNINQEFTIAKHIKTCYNERGACAINSTNDMTVLVTLDKTEGELIFYNDFLKRTNSVKAFNTGIQEITLNFDVILSNKV
jgi:hypothetical protein